MNINFCVSSIPNQRMVRGIKTATGTLRMNTDTGRVNASKIRYEPAMIPSGTPTRMASRKPPNTRFNVAAMLASRARSVKRVGIPLITSAGLGSITGDTIRVSAVAPSVMSHQKSPTSATQISPAKRRTNGGDSLRRVKMLFSDIYAPSWCFPHLKGSRLSPG